MKAISSSQKPFFLSFLIILLFCSCQLYAKQTKPKRSKRHRKLAATAQPRPSKRNTIGKGGLTNSDSMAGIQKKRDIPEIVLRSDLIIRGKVISTESQWKEDARGEHIYTTITVKILDKIKGSIKDDTFTFEVIGGTDGEITEIVSNTPVFEVDEDAIVFLAKHPRTNKQVTNGKILIYDGRVYQNDMELTADSFIQSLKTLKKAPGTTGPWGKKYKVPAARAEDVPNIKDISFDEALAVTNKQVAITGTNFGSTQGSSNVKFFNKNKQQKIPASIVSWSDTQIICTVPANISSGSSPVTVTTNDGTSSSYNFMAAACFIYSNYKWSGTYPTVYYYINENTSDCYGEGVAVQMAAATWNAVNSNFTLQYGGSSSCASTNYDGTNCIFWDGYFLPGILAQATQWIIGSELVECEIEFNDYDYSWHTNPYSYEMDVESVAVHELGHWLCLLDLYDYDDSDKVMYYQLGAGQIERVLHSCDCDGICYIYGGYDCGCTGPTVPNDMFADAIVISGLIGQTTGSNVGATKESGEPTHASTGGASVWWRWTAPSSGQTTINTNGSSFDTLLGVYTGSSVGSLAFVASNDDGGGGLQSLVTFSAVSGTTYRIAVDGFAGAGGNVILNWNLVSVPTPPQAQSSGVTTFVDTPVTITLQATDDGLPDPPAALTYIIVSLPDYGNLSDPCGPITDPCTTLPNNGNQVEYVPTSGYEGQDSFTFIVNDGGVPPEGGDSSEVAVTINVSDCAITTIGTGTDTWSQPMHTFYHDSRTQVIYLSDEIGAGGNITDLALDVTTVPGQTMNNWLIRMKHTSLDNYGTAFFDPNAWTTVYDENELIGSTGWRTFTFSTQFKYNGTDNLLVDFSYNNSFYTGSGYCRYSNPGGTRSAYAYSDSSDGDPNGWSGVSLPTVYGSSNVPNIRLTVCDGGIINFVDWTRFANAWQSTGEPPSANWDQSCDIAPQGGDGVVDIKDINAFIDRWLGFEFELW